MREAKTARQVTLPTHDPGFTANIKVDILACYNIHQNNHSQYHISKFLKNAAWKKGLENGGTAQEIQAVIQKIEHQSLARTRLVYLLTFVQPDVPGFGAVWCYVLCFFKKKSQVDKLVLDYSLVETHTLQFPVPQMQKKVG